MISCLIRGLSLKNWQDKKPAGQIATLFLVMMVAVLIFILTTVNLGSLAISSTQLSNAADKATFNLASQLASKSNALYKSLGNKVKKCWKKGGFFSFGSLLAVVVAIAVIIAAPYIAPGLVVAMGSMAPVAAGAVGGMIGGAIGGGIDGGGVLMGAIRGAQIGAAIGGIASGAGLGTLAKPGILGTPSVFNPSGIPLSMSPTGLLVPGSAVKALSSYGLSISPTSASQGFFSSLLGKTFGSPIFQKTVGSPVGKVGTGFLSLGRQAYSSISADANISSTLSALARSLSGLPEYDRYREGAFLQAFSEVVDDPNKRLDTDDIDGDGNTEESVPDFSWWWQKRQDKYSGLIPLLTTATSAYIGGPFTAFDSVAAAQYACPAQSESGSPGQLTRAEQCWRDGRVIELARALTNADYPVSFWKPGWTPPVEPPDEDCANNGNCGGNDFDDVETVVNDLQDFHLTAEGSDGDGIKYKLIPTLVSTWQSWIKVFYRTDEEGNHREYEFVGRDQSGNYLGDFIREEGGYRYVGNRRGDYERNDDFYSVFGIAVDGEDLNNNGTYGENNIPVSNSETVNEVKGIGGVTRQLPGWKQEIENKRRQLEDCTYCYKVGEYEYEICDDEPPRVSYPIYIKNPPCKDDINPVTRADADFGSIDSDLDDEFTNVQQGLSELIQEVNGFRRETGNYFNYMDDTTKKALNDWGGMNPARYPWADSRGQHSVIVQAGPFKIPWIKKKKKKKKICLILRDYYDDGSNTWIRVTRNDPGNKNIGLLGKWNPNFSGEITKFSGAGFSYDYVDIRRK